MRTTTAAQCAAVIRKELKANFPTQKFTVQSENYTGGDSVRIKWVDGVTEKAVKDIVDKYQYGHFNGMEDMYEHSNQIEGLPQVKFVFANREFSVTAKQRAKDQVCKDFGIDASLTGRDFDNACREKMGCWGDQAIYRHIHEQENAGV